MAKSGESLENRRVEFLESAIKRKRMRKNVKRKGLSTVPSGGWREANSRMKIVGIHPAVFARGTTGIPGWGKCKRAQGTDLKGVF